MIQHDMMMFDHGMPGPDGKVSPEQRPEADVNIEFQATSKMADGAQKLAWFFKAANEKYATDYPAAVGPHMTNTDSTPFMDIVPAISLRENERGAQIGGGWDPHWHQPTDVFTTFTDKDFRLGLNAAQTTLGGGRAAHRGDGKKVARRRMEPNKTAGRLLARRRLLQLAAASPLAAAGLLPSRLGGLLAKSPQSTALPSPGQPEARLITKAGDALDVFDFEAVARKTLPPGHFGYLTTGTDGEDTIRANREAFNRYQLRVRRLVNVASLDTSVTLFGRTYESPIALAPIGSQRAFHPDAENAVARAARARRHLQILSTVSSTSVEAVNAERGEPVCTSSTRRTTGR